MAKRSRKQKTLGNPVGLASRDADDPSVIQVVIETPKGSRNKYAYDPEQRIFQLKKVLPAGMAFPYDFGFIPSTIAEDRDPMDVLVLMDEPAFAGCLLRCRLIGIIEGDQGKKRQSERNDRIVAVEEENHSYAHVKHIKDLGKEFVEELGGVLCELPRVERKTVSHFGCAWSERSREARSRRRAGS